MKPPLRGLSSSLLVLSLALVSALSTMRAQDATTDPADAPTPAPTARPRPRPAPTPDFSVPVGTVNGVAIYRPLLKSEMANALDRALVINDFNKRGTKLSPAQVDAAVADYKRAHFNNNDAKLDAKLKELGATPTDFRQFVTEEARIHIMLAGAGRGSVSEDAAKRAQGAYVAGLRARATINTPR